MKRRWIQGGLLTIAGVAVFGQGCAAQTEDGASAGMTREADTLPSVQVVAVEPADGRQTSYPIEHRPTRVRFKVTNATSAPRKGTVTASIQGVGGAHISSTAWPIDDLEPGQEANGVLFFDAPGANDPSAGHHTIVVTFSEPLPSIGEFPTVRTSQSPVFSFDTGARYWAGVESFYVVYTRSGWPDWHDTDYLALTSGLAKPSADGSTWDIVSPRSIASSTPCGPPGTRCAPAMTYVPQAYIAPIDTMVGRNEAVALQYSLYNKGHLDYGETVKSVSDAFALGGEGVLDYFVPAAAPVWKEITDLVMQLHTSLAAGCDGPVAHSQVTIPSEQLLVLTSGGAEARFTDENPEDAAHPPAAGYVLCQHSTYDVTWRMARSTANDAFRVVPDAGRELTLGAGEQVHFTLDAHDDHGNPIDTTQGVQWTVVGAPAAGTITSSGTYVAPTDISGYAAPASYVTVRARWCELVEMVQGQGATTVCHDAENYVRLEKKTAAASLPFWNVSTRRVTSTGTWSSGSIAECGSVQAMSGLSTGPSTEIGHAALCATEGSGFPHQACHAVAFARPQTTDWAGGNFEAACASNEYAAGISQDGSGELSSVLCCALDPAAAAHNACTVETFDAGDARESGSLPVDWDYGFYKGECGQGRYVAGVSARANTVVGYGLFGPYFYQVPGGPHSILCCD